MSREKTLTKAVEIIADIKNGAEIKKIECVGGDAVVTYNCNVKKHINMTNNPCAASAIELFEMIV